MNKYRLMLLPLAACIAGAAFAQDQATAQQDQAKQHKASATVKLRPADSARAATGMKDGQQVDAVARKERAEQVAGSLQKKTNDTAKAAASNVK